MHLILLVLCNQATRILLRQSIMIRTIGLSQTSLEFSKLPAESNRCNPQVQIVNLPKSRQIKLFKPKMHIILQRCMLIVPENNNLNAHFMGNINIHTQFLTELTKYKLRKTVYIEQIKFC